MSDFHRASAERINVFHVDDTYLFKHFFDEDEIFSTLKQFYNNENYRFEVPPPAFEEIERFLTDYDYAPVIVEDIEPFAVVVRKYTDHPRNIFKDAVVRRSVDDYNLFVLTDSIAVEQAVTQGASRIESTDLDLDL